MKTKFLVIFVSIFIICPFVYTQQANKVIHKRFQVFQVKKKDLNHPISLLTIYIFLLIPNILIQ